MASFSARKRVYNRKRVYKNAAYASRRKYVIIVHYEERRKERNKKPKKELYRI